MKKGEAMTPIENFAKEAKEHPDQDILDELEKLSAELARLRESLIAAAGWFIELGQPTLAERAAEAAKK